MADATQVKRRRGTASQCNAGTPAEGEIWVDLTNDRIRLGDGVQVGGIIIGNAYDAQNQKFTFAVNSTVSGTPNVLILTLDPAPYSIAANTKVSFKAAYTTTGAVTATVNGSTPTAVYKMVAGAFVQATTADLVQGMYYDITWDGARWILNGGVGGVVTVGQGDLKTSTGTFSSFVSIIVSSNLQFGNSNIILPGGQYGFFVESNGLGSSNAGWWPAGAGSAGLVAGVNAWSQSSVGTPAVDGRQRYVTASPPYDLGDGEVGGFIFALVDKAGNIVAHYAADAPPWAYNGPTNITPSHVCRNTGKKFINVKRPCTFDDVIKGVKTGYDLVEITHDIKNADMSLIPHPFNNIHDDHTVVLLDPMSDMIRRVIDYQNDSGTNDIAECLRNGHIKIDNRGIKRSCHKSVMPVKFSYKRT